MRTTVGPMELRSPLVAASGTVGSVWEWADVADVRPYGAAVAKSVAPTEWKGRPAPRLAPVAAGMLNGIGIQNAGIDAWLEEMAPVVPRLDVPVWGSAVGRDAEGFTTVALGLESAGVAAIEVNLSCPNLEDGQMFSFDTLRSAEIVSAVKEATEVPVGAKLSPNTPDVVGVSAACAEAGADFVVLTNTAFGFGVSLDTKKPLLSGGVGGYSGPGLKPLSIRCVYEVGRALPTLPIVGCGGVTNGRDVLEYLIAGASAVEMGTIHLAEPKAGVRIARELDAVLDTLEIRDISSIIGGVDEW